jgi:hypothetical protein
MLAELESLSEEEARSGIETCSAQALPARREPSPGARDGTVSDVG